MYVLKLKELADQDVCLISSKSDQLQLWHRILGFTSTSVIEKLQRLNIVEGLPKLNTHTDAICEACAEGKQIKSFFNSKTEVSTSGSLELLHMDLFGSISTVSLSGKYYGYVIVDDYSRYTWVHFLQSKNEAFQHFSKFSKDVQKEKDAEISKVRSDHGKEFENSEFKSFCEDHGITHQFSAPKIPQQNGVVERKNRTL